MVKTFSNRIREALKFLRYVFAYRRTLWYLLRKRGISATWNFLYVKSFVAAGGEGTGRWLYSMLIEPIFRWFPSLAMHLVPYPNTIEVEITNRCDKRCLICEHTYWNEPNKDLSFDEFKLIVSQFPKLKWVNLTGEGDAFLNRDYLKMIEYMKKRGAAVFLVDSFDLIDESVSEQLVSLGVDGIWISFDAATKVTYEEIKLGCSFERSINNIKKLLEIKRRMGSPIPELCFRYIVNKLNVQEMPQFIELVRSLGTKNELGDGSQVEFAGLLVFPAVEHLFVEEIPDEIINATITTAADMGVKVSFAHSSKSNLPPLECCRAWHEPYMMMGGYVMPCCAVLQNNSRDFLREHAFGNILQAPFKDIWYSERYKNFRAIIPKSNEKVPILCRGCRAYNTTMREQAYGVSSDI